MGQRLNFSARHPRHLLYVKTRNMGPFSKPLDRRLGHLEEVINARSAEQIAALDQLVAQLEAISASHRDLAQNITQLIESHLEFHVESMATIGTMLAEMRRLEAADDTRASQAVSDTIAGEG